MGIRLVSRMPHTIYRFFTLTLYSTMHFSSSSAKANLLVKASFSASCYKRARRSCHGTISHSASLVLIVVMTWHTVETSYHTTTAGNILTQSRQNLGCGAY